jgi:hypothetical protein
MQNATKANICHTVDEYKWSGDVFYRRDLKGFVNIDIIFSMLDSNRKEALRKYKELMIEKEEVDYEKEKVIGDEAYQLMCLNKRK